MKRVWLRRPTLALALATLASAILWAMAWFAFQAQHLYDCLDVGLSQVDICEAHRKQVISSPWSDISFDLFAALTLALLVATLANRLVGRGVRRPSS